MYGLLKIISYHSDTVSRTGVYCSASIALEQCKIEGVVDVFQVTKAVKRSKPGAITSQVIISAFILNIIIFTGTVYFHL